MDKIYPGSFYFIFTEHFKQVIFQCHNLLKLGLKSSPPAMLGQLVSYLIDLQ